MNHQAEDPLEAVRRRLNAEVESGRTITAIAKQADITRSQLSRFLRRERELSADEWLRLARVLDVTVTTEQDETQIGSGRSSVPAMAVTDVTERLSVLCSQFDEDEAALFSIVLQRRASPFTIEELAQELCWDVRHAKAVAKLIDLRLISYPHS